MHRSQDEWSDMYDALKDELAETLKERDAWRGCIEDIVRELDDEDGTMDIDLEPLDLRETSPEDVVKAVRDRHLYMMGWVRRYIMGEPMRGDATGDEEKAREKVRCTTTDLREANERAEKAERERDEAVALLRLFKGGSTYDAFMPEPPWRRLDEFLAKIDGGSDG
jgi:hypothetical protein